MFACYFVAFVYIWINLFSLFKIDDIGWLYGGCLYKYVKIYMKMELIFIGRHCHINIICCFSLFIYLCINYY